MRGLWVIAFVLGAPVWGQNAPVLEAFIDGRIEVRDIRIDASARDAGQGVLWSDEIALAGSDYVRLLVRSEGARFPLGTRLILAGAMGQNAEVELSALSEAGEWTPLMPFGRVRMALVSQEPVPDTSVLVIDSLAMQSTKLARYSVYGPNQLTLIHDPEVPEYLKTLAPAVALLSFVDAGHPRTCTGFLIGPDQLMTNEHCIRDEQTCASMTAVFGYEYDRSGRLQIGTQVGCQGVETLMVNRELDASLVTLSNAPGAQYGQLVLADTDAQAEVPMAIIQHPGSQPKQASVLDCAAGDVRIEGRGVGTDFAHTCDTSGGSSGAPVLNADGQVIGLHHFGFQDGDGWDRNRAVHMDLIADWLSTPPETSEPYPRPE